MHGVQKQDYWYPTAFSLWGDLEQEAIQRVIASDRFTMGDEVAAFETEFAAYHNMRHGIMVNSGSSANLVVVAALAAYGDKPLQRGDTVLVPALAWSTTYAPLIQYGLKLQLMDCDDSWCACTSLSDLLHRGVRLSVGVSILGAPAMNLVKFRSLMEARGGWLIEDNCEALGAQYYGRPTGTTGLMSSFSFFYSHQISAVEGGMILTNDDECARLCRILRAHGWTRDVDPPASFDQEYNFTHFGLNVRPTEIHAAVARVQLTRLEEFVAKRRENLKFFHERAAAYGLPIKHQNVKGLYTSPFGLAFTVGSTEIRTKLVQALRVAGIDCRLPTGGCFQLHPYGAPWRDQRTPNAERIHQTGLFLGNAPFDIHEKIERAVQIMKEVLL